MQIMINSLCEENEKVALKVKNEKTMIMTNRQMIPMTLLTDRRVIGIS